MKPTIIFEKRPNIALFVQQTLHLMGIKNSIIIKETIELINNKNNNKNFGKLLIDIEKAYDIKNIINEHFDTQEEKPSITFYQVENDKVTGFWNEGFFPNQPALIDKYIYIRSRGKLEKLKIEDILHVESDKKYCTITTQQKKYVLRIALKKLHEQLNNSNFIRVHRSYLVNKKHISVIDTQNQNLIVANSDIPIGRHYQENLYKQIAVLQ